MVCIAKINIWTMSRAAPPISQVGEGGAGGGDTTHISSGFGQAWAWVGGPTHISSGFGQAWAWVGGPTHIDSGRGRTWAGVGGCGRPHPKDPTHLQLGPSGLVRDTAVGVAPSRLLRNDPWWDDVHSKRSLTNGTGIRLGSSWYSGLNTYFKFYSDT